MTAQSYIEDLKNREAWAKSQAARFWRRVQKGKRKACWPWVGATASNGYGNVSYLGRWWKAHRLAYFLSKGLIPRGQLIRHTCDNPSCCNSAHLLAGSAQDNSDDAVERNRMACGERHTLSKLTDSIVRSMRRAHRQGTSPTALGKRYGVDRATAWKAITGRTWKHVTD